MISQVLYWKISFTVSVCFTRKHKNVNYLWEKQLKFAATTLKPNYHCINCKLWSQQSQYSRYTLTQYLHYSTFRLHSQRPLLLKSWMREKRALSKNTKCKSAMLLWRLLFYAVDLHSVLFERAVFGVVIALENVSKSFITTVMNQ